MEKQTPDYESMEKEYSQIKPFEFAEKADETGEKDANSSQNIKAELYGFYTEIQAYLNKFTPQKRLFTIWDIIYRTLQEILDELKKHKDFTPRENLSEASLKGLFTYNYVIRAALAESAQALDLSGNYLKTLSPRLITLQQNLHLLLVTLLNL